MWLMLQQEHPEDLVIATGEQHSVRTFIEQAASILDLQVIWKGSGLEEIGLDNTGRHIISVDPRYFRPTEVDSLLGDSSLARQKLGWTPKVSFKELVAEMVRYDMELAQREALLSKHGYPPQQRHE
jgi:GDPmannose 4,6-dehydratase